MNHRDKNKSQLQIQPNDCDSVDRQKNNQSAFVDFSRQTHRKQINHDDLKHQRPNDKRFEVPIESKLLESRVRDIHIGFGPKHKLSPKKQLPPDFKTAMAEKITSKEEFYKGIIC